MRFSSKGFPLGVAVALLAGCGAPELGGADGDEPACAGGTGGGCEPVGSTAQAVNPKTINSNWTNCAVGSNCEDVYQFQAQANDRVAIRVSGLTNGSILRLAAYASVFPSAINLLTGDSKDHSCNGTGNDTVTFTTPKAGTYFFSIGRDASSPGTSGNYSVTYEGTLTGMTFVGQHRDNASNNRPKGCGWNFLQSAVFSCQSPAPANCQHVYDFDVPANTTVTLTAGSPPAGVDLSLALFGPQRPLDFQNLLTNLASDDISRAGNRSCRGRGLTETATVFLKHPGVHRMAIVYESSRSDPAVRTGTYTVGFSASQPVIARGRTVTNGPNQQAPFLIECSYNHRFQVDWACAGGSACQDVFDYHVATPASMFFAIFDVSGQSRPRLALFGGSSLTGTNLFNNRNTDRQCVGPNQQDSVTSSNVSGPFRLALGREATSSGNFGSAVYKIVSPHPLTVGLQTVNNQPPGLTGTSCP